MKRRLFVLVLTVAAVVVGTAVERRSVTAQGQTPASAAPAPRPPKCASRPDLPYVPVDNFLKLPAGMSYGTNVMAAAVNSKNHIFVFHRAPVPLFEFGPDGTFIRAF